VNFSNYADFRNVVQVMLDGDDISTSDLSVDVLDTIIGAGEQRIYRELRSSTQDTAYAISTTNNMATLPTDFLELHGAPYVGTFGVATYRPWEDLQNMVQLGSDTSNHPVFYSFQSDAMFFYPMTGTGVVVTGQYYKRFADISTGLNALFTRHPDVFLYASLAESAPFLGEQERGPVWDAKYTSLVNAANEQELRRYTRGGKLSTRVG
jgi:hypothetical protein